MPLSAGHFDGKSVECSYHGWRFAAQTGQCLEIPSITEDSKLKVERIFCGSYLCEERDGYIWVPFVVPVFRIFAKTFIGQDQHTMEQQVVGLKNHPSLMLIDDADRPARWYFQLKKAHLESGCTGQPFEHPIPGPVTLRWRS